MALLPIILVPDPVLKQKAQPIETITDDIRRQAADMVETMYAAPGIGLAANQINRLNRLIVLDPNYRHNDGSRDALVMINPEIVWESEEISIMEEGCLSIPQQYAEVERPASVRVKYVDLDGTIKEWIGDGLASHCVQHEIDHLNGTLFIDHLSRLKRNIIMRKFSKLSRDKEVL